MNNWNFSPEHSISLTLAADARMGSTDYTNDQIWELKMGSSDPPSISLDTTFGLRARLCRIFPRFIYNGKVVNDPSQFSHPITIHRYYPNYLELSFKPFSCINVNLEYWVPSSQVIAGRIKITNTTNEKCAVQLELAELLLPSSDGFHMSVKEIEMTTLLAGRSSNLSPVLFLTGGAQAGKSPYPSLQLSYVIPAHGEQEANWAHASLDTIDKSYELVKEVISKNWQAEFARITRIHSKQLEIHTGNKDWDTAFFLSQILAYQFFLQPTRYCNAPSTVTTRKPDQGFSLLGDGSDYNHLWNGQTPIDSHYLTNILLPASPELVKGLLDNFLDIQTSHGEIDSKPGLAAQRSHLLASPLLVDIALQLFEFSGDFNYLKSVYPKLFSFFLSWFTSSHDRDRDQIPEWDQVVQIGFEDLPFFSQHHPSALGVDISTIEGPGLSSYLYRECISLIKIGNFINDHDAVQQLESFAEKLKSMVEQSWSEQYACYLYRDRDSHISSPGELLGTLKGAGIIEIQRDFYHPVRPIISIESQQEVTHPIKIFIQGTGTTGTHRVELIPASGIHWSHQCGHTTSAYTYSSIECIEVNGIRSEDTVIAQTVNLTCMDQSLLLPIWARIPSKERAKILINLTVMNKKRFLGPYGLRSWIKLPGMSEIPEENYGLYLPWTALILDGLIQYGERTKAAEVFMRFMKPVAKALQKDMTLNQSYHNETGKPIGVQNSITSLIPPGLFLRILGIKIVNPFTVEIVGNNPFPWPVTVKYQGLTIIKEEKKTLVIFPDGQNLTVENDQYQRISCKKQAQTYLEK
jgi:hypothetical protein